MGLSLMHPAPRKSPFWQGSKKGVVDAAPWLCHPKAPARLQNSCAKIKNRSHKAALVHDVPAPDKVHGGFGKGRPCPVHANPHGTLHPVLRCVFRSVTQGFGLEHLPLQRDARGHIVVDDCMRTSLPGVYACGDLNGYSLLAHTAVREAEVAVHDILGHADAMSYRAIPGVVYTNPEVAGVGETEESLRQKGTPYRAVRLPMAYSGRFVAENEGVNGVCKVLLGEADGKVLGAHVLGNPASEIITLAAMAIDLGLTAEEWKRVVFPHPTVGEIFREVL